MNVLHKKKQDELSEGFLEDDVFKPKKRSEKGQYSVDYNISESEEDEAGKFQHRIGRYQDLGTIEEMDVEETPQSRMRKSSAKSGPSKNQNSEYPDTEWTSDDDMTEHTFKYLKESQFSSEYTNSKYSSNFSKKDGYGKIINTPGGKKKRTRSRRSFKDPSNKEDPFELLERVEGFHDSKNQSDKKDVPSIPKPPKAEEQTENQKEQLGTYDIPEEPEYNEESHHELSKLQKKRLEKKKADDEVNDSPGKNKNEEGDDNASDGEYGEDSTSMIQNQDDNESQNSYSQISSLQGLKSPGTPVHMKIKQNKEQRGRKRSMGNPKYNNDSD